MPEKKRSNGKKLIEESRKIRKLTLASFLKTASHVVCRLVDAYAPLCASTASLAKYNDFLSTNLSFLPTLSFIANEYYR